MAEDEAQVSVWPVGGHLQLAAGCVGEGVEFRVGGHLCLGCLREDLRMLRVEL